MTSQKLTDGTPADRSSSDSDSESQAGRERAASRGSLKELLLVSLPLMVSSGSHSLMTLIDRIMLAHYQPSATESVTAVDVLAAVTPASMLHWTILCVPLGMVLYANTFVAQYDGAGQHDRMMMSFFQAVWLAVFCGLVMVVFVPLAGPIFEWVGHAPNVIRQERRYYETLCAFSVIPLLGTGLSCFFSGRQKTTVVMLVNVGCVAINVALDAALIFGQWGFPKLGIQGAALATLGAELGHVAIYAHLIRRGVRRDRLPVRDVWKIHAAEIRRYLRYGLPGGFHYFVDISGFFAFLLLVGRLDVDSLAATNLAFSINGLIFVPLMGFGTAVQTLVGHHLGARDQAGAIRTTWNACRMGLVWTGAAALLLICFPEFCVTPFVPRAGAMSSGNDITAILPMVQNLLFFVAVYSVFDALAVVFASALRGAGDSLFPMLLTLCSSWLVMTLPAWLMVEYEWATIERLWLTCTAHITLMGLAMLLRFLTGRWKSFRLVENNE